MEDSKKTNSTINLGWRHLQTLLLLLGMTIGYSLRVCLSVAIVAMRNSTKNSGFPQYDWDQSTSTIILGSFFWGYVVTQFPSGYFARTGSAFKILAFGMLTCSILNMLTPWLAKFGPVAVMCGRIGMGLGQGVLNPCTHTLISRWVPPMERSRLGSAILNGMPLGTIIGMSMSGVLAGSRFGWPSIFYFFGTIGIIWSLLFYCYGADYPSEHSKIDSKEVQYIESSLRCLSDSAELANSQTVPWKAILTSVPYWSFIIVGCGNTWGFYTFITQLPTYLKYALNYDVSQSGIVSSLPYIVMWLLGIPISFLSDYALSKGVPIAIVRKICAIIGLWIPSACMIALAIADTSNKTIIVAILVIGIGFNCASTCSTQINQIDLAPNYVAALTAFGSTMTNLVSLGLPYLFKLIVEDATNVGQWKIVFVITAGIYFLSNLIFLVFGSCDVQPWNNPDNKIKSRLSP